ncbi:disulfide bond formation protein B [Rhizorhabdus dicambivorans]|uniref:Disulfide bond formation protein B n=1 Tax=Rhizorhabdus dicambivorans TaxID=1850238 RepID=A0A2A4FUH8_9SPHN|nr:disulfide bond formation protein B [Rhizorhabdus dicambivorans]ATE63564.1 disulfide bond formation protein B [Rhizorhabdus dicambivorans]PCE41380.1 disulfide bond formation protein B [Rhizorhabdus dicambivorans]
MTGFAQARLAALLLPTALMAGALGSQYIGHLFPCEMCHWQRWPHYAAIALAAIAFLVPERPLGRILVGLAIAAILASGAIGIFHAGVEYHFWPGITRCAAPPSSRDGADILAQIMATPMIQCDVPQWTLFGISLAGFNALFSILGAFGIIAVWRRKP